MDNQKMKKSEIDIEIKDLLWELVRKWRIIVVMAIICAVGLAAYQYRIDRNKTDVVVVKKTQEELEKAMSVQDISEVTGAVNLLNQLGEKSAYMDASVLMQINPYEEKVVLLQYVIEAEQVEEVLAKAYRAYIEDGYMAQLLAGFRGVEALYVQELISVVDDNTDMYVYSDTMDESIQMELANKEADACFTVKICGLDEASITEMAQNIKTSLNVYSGDLKQKVGEHELKLIEETACVLVDNALAELQNRNATAIKTISNNIDKMKNEMNNIHNFVAHALDNIAVELLTVCSIPTLFTKELINFSLTYNHKNTIVNAADITQEFLSQPFVMRRKINSKLGGVEVFSINNKFKTYILSSSSNVVPYAHMLIEYYNSASYYGVEKLKKIYQCYLCSTYRIRSFRSFSG